MLTPSPEDRAAIEDLYARYYWATDTGDSAAYVACFSPDAVIYEMQPDGSLLKAGVSEFIERYHRQSRVIGHQHRQSNTRYEPDPDGRPDHWRLWAYTFATHAEPNDPDTPDHPAARVTWSGYTADTVGKRDGRWLILEKAIAPWTGNVIDIRKLAD